MDHDEGRVPSHEDIECVLLSQADIKGIVKRMGEELAEDYRESNPLFIAILRGAVVFFADLIRAVHCPMQIDFMAVSSYGSAAKSSGVVRILKDLDTPIEGRDIVIVEDILDTGITLNYLIKNLESRGPRSIEIAAFLVKDVPGQRSAVLPRYVGAHVPDAFVVGYGLDYDERYRNLPYLGVLKPEVYS